eukprot:1786984-Prymnesium_polylepis.1
MGHRAFLRVRLSWSSPGPGTRTTLVLTSRTHKGCPGDRQTHDVVGGRGGALRHPGQHAADGVGQRRAHARHHSHAAPHRRPGRGAVSGAAGGAPASGRGDRAGGACDGGGVSRRACPQGDAVHA